MANGPIGHAGQIYDFLHSWAELRRAAPHLPIRGLPLRLLRTPGVRSATAGVGTSVISGCIIEGLVILPGSRTLQHLAGSRCYRRRGAIRYGAVRLLSNASGAPPGDLLHDDRLARLA